MKQVLSPSQRLLKINDTIRRLLEEVDDRGRQISLLLQEVYSEQLFAVTHLTYGAWFEELFKKDRRRGYQLLAWAKLSTIVDNECQARALSKAPPELQALILEESGGRTGATAARIQETTERVVIQRQATREKAAAGADTYREFATRKDIDRALGHIIAAEKIVTRCRLDMSGPVDHLEEALASARRLAQEVEPLR